MSIKTECPECGRSYQLPDANAGRQVKCKECGGAFEVPARGAGSARASAGAVAAAAAPPAVSKICCVCGQDVAGKPRTKDGQGRYYCQPCWTTAKQQEAQPAEARESSSRAPSGEADILDIAAGLVPSGEIDESAQQVMVLPPELEEAPYEAESPVRAGAHSAHSAPVQRGQRGQRKPDSARKVKIWQIVAGVVLVVAVLGYAVPTLGLLLSPVAMIGGALAIMAGNLWFLGIAFQESGICGLMCMFVPFYSFYYLISRWSETQRAFFCAVIGVAIVILGMTLALRRAGVEGFLDDHSTPRMVLAIHVGGHVHGGPGRIPT